MPEPVRKAESVTYKIGGKEIELVPLPYGRLRKVLRVVMRMIDDLSKMDTSNLQALPDVLEGATDAHLQELLPLVFDPAKYDWLTREWIDDNLTLPLINHIRKDFMELNGLDDFFGKKGQPAAAPAGK